MIIRSTNYPELTSIRLIDRVNVLLECITTQSVVWLYQEGFLESFYLLCASLYLLSGTYYAVHHVSSRL